MKRGPVTHVQTTDALCAELRHSFAPVALTRRLKAEAGTGARGRLGPSSVTAVPPSPVHPAYHLDSLPIATLSGLRITDTGPYRLSHGFARLLVCLSACRLSSVRRHGHVLSALAKRVHPSRPYHSSPRRLPTRLDYRYTTTRLDSSGAAALVGFTVTLSSLAASATRLRLFLDRLSLLASASHRAPSSHLPPSSLPRRYRLACHSQHDGAQLSPTLSFLAFHQLCARHAPDQTWDAQHRLPFTRTGLCQCPAVSSNSWRFPPGSYEPPELQFQRLQQQRTR